MWDTGRAPTAVIEHGVVDPGPVWTGELAACGRRRQRARSGAADGRART